MNSNDIDWNDVIKKEARAYINEDLSKVKGTSSKRSIYFQNIIFSIE